MSYARHPKIPAATPTDYPEALKGEEQLIDSLITSGYSGKRNLAVQNIHEDRTWDWIKPGNCGLVDRFAYVAAQGWLKLVDVEVPQKETKTKSQGGSK